VAALLILGEGVALVFAYGETLGMERRVEQRQRELAAVRGISPAPTAGVAAAIAADVAQAESSLATLQAALRGGRLEAELRTAAVPAKPTDSYFDLAAMAETLRGLAQAGGVGLDPQEHFGFSAYANGGPPQELIPAVFRQRQVLHYLLTALFAAGPQRLVAVARNQPGGAPSPATGRVASRDKDVFALDPGLSVAIPGFVSTSAYRIVFVGKTEVLRRWLNELAKFELPVVVRAVEAEPQTATEAMAAARPSPGSLVLTGAAGDEVPIVRSAPSKFTVELECVELLQPLPGKGAAP
jgi:hypothetical protein